MLMMTINSKTSVLDSQTLWSERHAVVPTSLGPLTYFFFSNIELLLNFMLAFASENVDAKFHVSTMFANLLQIAIGHMNSLKLFCVYKIFPQCRALSSHMPK